MSRFGIGFLFNLFMAVNKDLIILFVCVRTSSVQFGYGLVPEVHLLWRVIIADGWREFERHILTLISRERGPVGEGAPVRVSETDLV